MYEQLRAAILDGRLGPGLRLPASRALAELLGISRSTATATYELLLNEGYLESRRGSGTHVTSALGQRSAKSTQNATLLVRKLNAQWRESVPLFPRSAAPTKFDFSMGYPEQGSFPFDIWRRHVSRALRSIESSRIVRGDPQGEALLREAISHHVSQSRAVACRADDVIVTAGAQQAFDLLARILVTPKRSQVVVENPCYTPLLTTLVACGATLIPVPIDNDGMMTDKLQIGRAHV